MIWSWTRSLACHQGSGCPKKLGVRLVGRCGICGGDARIRGRRAFAFFLLINLLLMGCAEQTPRQGAAHLPEGGLRFLALGDSYTIGESVSDGERWPVQLVAQLRTRGIAMADPVIIARTGWTSGELLAALEGENPSGPYQLVSLLVGVNNQYRGGGLEEYRSELRLLLQRAVALAGGKARRVMVLSIPDWGVTPFAEGRDRSRISAEIDAFNSVNREEAGRFGVNYVDVTDVSRRARQVPAYLAADGLHPSGEMYAAWVTLALPSALEALSAEE
jgi:lysophospholipase L1-like esterase